MGGSVRLLPEWNRIFKNNSVLKLTGSKGGKNKDATESLQSLMPTSTVKGEHSLAPRKIIIDSHRKNLCNLSPIMQHHPVWF